MNVESVLLISFFRGGRTEVFNLEFRQENHVDRVIEYLDVNALYVINVIKLLWFFIFFVNLIFSSYFRYPSIILSNDLPKNKFHHIMYQDCQRISLQEEGFFYQGRDGITRQIFGILYVKIFLPKINSLKNIAFLPTKMFKKNFVASCKACLSQLSKNSCK